MMDTVSLWRRALPLLLLVALGLTACAPQSGIFSSSAWQSSGLSRQHIRVLAVDPNNPQNMYAGDTSDGVFASSDGGQRWTKRSVGLPATTAIHDLAFDDPGKKLYAATGNGLYVSADGGQLWSTVNDLPPDDYTSLAFDLKVASIIYIGTAHHGVLVSRDGGDSWSIFNGSLPAGAAINNLTLDSEAHQLWAATSIGIYRLNSNATGWQAMNTGLPSGIVVYTVIPASIYGGAAGLVYAGTNQGFFLSRDNAARWQPGQNALNRLSIYAILPDIHSVSTIYIATNAAGVLRSDDNGENWRSVATGLPGHQPIYALLQGGSGYGQLFAANNDVYLFPGNGGPFDISRVLVLLLIALFFYVLIRLSTSGRRKARKSLLPEPNNAPEPEKNARQ